MHHRSGRRALHQRPSFPRCAEEMFYKTIGQSHHLCLSIVGFKIALLMTCGAHTIFSVYDGGKGGHLKSRQSPMHGQSKLDHCMNDMLVAVTRKQINTPSENERATGSTKKRVQLVRTVLFRHRRKSTLWQVSRPLHKQTVRRCCGCTRIAFLLLYTYPLTDT